MSSYTETHLYKALFSYHKKYLDLCKQLETETNGKEITRINKEISKLTEISENFLVYKKELENENECLKIIKQEKNQEFIKLAQEELENSKQQIKKLEIYLQKLLIPKDPLDEKNVIVEMRAAAGGDESSIFVENLFGVYKKYSDLNK